MPTTIVRMGIALKSLSNLSTSLESYITSSCYATCSMEFNTSNVCVNPELFAGVKRTDMLTKTVRLSIKIIFEVL
jgi:hypothetical protein